MKSTVKAIFIFLPIVFLISSLLGAQNIGEPQLKKMVEYFKSDTTNTKVEYLYYVVDQEPYDQKHGVYKWFFDNGKTKAITHYRWGHKDGNFITYNRWGSKRAEGNFRKGQLDGICKNYFEGGGLENAGEYSGGRRNGEWKFYTKGGRVQKIVTYDNGYEVEK